MADRLPLVAQALQLQPHLCEEPGRLLQLASLLSVDPDSQARPTSASTSVGLRLWVVLSPCPDCQTICSTPGTRTAALCPCSAGSCIPSSSTSQQQAWQLSGAALSPGPARWPWQPRLPAPPAPIAPGLTLTWLAHAGSAAAAAGGGCAAAEVAPGTGPCPAAGAGQPRACGRPGCTHPAGVWGGRRCKRHPGHRLRLCHGSLPQRRGASCVRAMALASHQSCIAAVLLGMRCQALVALGACAAGKPPPAALSLLGLADGQ